MLFSWRGRGTSRQGELPGAVPLRHPSALQPGTLGLYTVPLPPSCWIWIRTLIIFSCMSTVSANHPFLPHWKAPGKGLLMKGVCCSEENKLRHITPREEARFLAEPSRELLGQACDAAASVDGRGAPQAGTPPAAQAHMGATLGFPGESQSQNPVWRDCHRFPGIPT